jgi:hypothetical protein
VEFCSDLHCDRVLDSVATDETTAAPTRDLPTGLVFWRVRDPARRETTSPTRWFHVPHGTPSAADPGGSSVALSAQFDGDCDGHGEALDADGTLRRQGSRSPGDGVAARLDLAGVAHVIAAGDIDGDGFPDVAGLAATPDGRGPSVVVWRGPVQGDMVAPSWVLRLPDPASEGSGAAGFELVAGDFDGDGRRDLIVSSLAPQAGRGRLLVVPGSAEPPPAARVTQLRSPWGTSGVFRALAAGDLDGDGFDELLTTTSGEPAVTDSAAVIYTGTIDGPDPTPQWMTRGAATRADGPRYAALFADADGDGWLDVVFAGPRVRFRPCVFVAGWRVLQRLVSQTFFVATCKSDDAPTGAVPSAFGTAIVGGDFNGDGLSELVIEEKGAADSRLWTAPGRDRGAASDLASSPLFAGGGTTPHVASLDMAELDGDGYPDLIVTPVNGPTLRYQGTPDGLRPWPAPP